MNFATIKEHDTANGFGIRVSLFVSGCTHHCKGCFNPETWDFNGGLEFDDSVIDEIIKTCEPEHITGLSILGGEPMHPNNIEGTIKLAKKFKEVYPKKNIWAWSGFLFDNICNKEIFNYIDVLVDGQFDEEQRNPKLKWRGSSNQRVIDVKKSLKKKDIVLFNN